EDTLSSQRFRSSEERLAFYSQPTRPPQPPISSSGCKTSRRLLSGSTTSSPLPLKELVKQLQPILNGSTRSLAINGMVTMETCNLLDEAAKKDNALAEWQKLRYVNHSLKPRMS